MPTHCTLTWQMQRNEEETNDGSEAFKESVTFIDFRALDPAHELSGAKDTFKNKLEKEIIITMTKEF